MNRPIALVALALAALALAAFAPRPARACASCACGDPTLTAMGSELPFEGRLRLALSASLRSEVAGVERVSRVSATEQRLALAASWSPIDALTVALAVPLVRRTAEEVSGRRHQGYGLGDLELRGRWTWTTRGEGTRHAVSLLAGADVPATPRLEAEGEALPIEAQPSSGAWSGVAGLAYGLFAFPWSAYVSASGRASSVGHLDVQAGPALLVTAAVQHQVSAAWALGLAAHVRLDAPATEEGVDDPHSGGLVAVVAPELRFSPVTDWVLSAELRIPAVAATRGEHDEGWGAELGVTCDL